MKYKQNLRNLQNQPVTVSQKTGLKASLNLSATYTQSSFGRLFVPACIITSVTVSLFGLSLILNNSSIVSSIFAPGTIRFSECELGLSFSGSICLSIESPKIMTRLSRFLSQLRLLIFPSFSGSLIWLCRSR